MQTLIEHELVDELRLMIHPIVLGSGRRLFGAAEEPERLQLAGSEVMTDVVVLTFRADA